MEASGYSKMKATTRSDVLFLDPNVVRCDKGFLKPTDGYFPVLTSLSKGDTGGYPPYRNLHEAPDFQHSPCTPDSVIPETREQIWLDLSPVCVKEFEDYFIIDEFEDAYSDDEEVPTGANSLNKENKIIPGLRNLLHDDIDELSKGKEIFIYIGPWKFLMYCCIQPVDGFGWDARAKARGSDKWSPLKANTTIEMENSSNCSKVIVSPVKGKLQDSKHSHDLYISGNVKKSPKLGKRGQGLIMLCSVRRSPRLNKGKLSQR